MFHGRRRATEKVLVRFVLAENQGHLALFKRHSTQSRSQIDPYLSLIPSTSPSLTSPLSFLLPPPLRLHQ